MIPKTEYDSDERVENSMCWIHIQEMHINEKALLVFLSHFYLCYWSLKENIINYSSFLKILKLKNAI